MEKTTREVIKFAADRGVAHCSVSLKVHNLILLMISFHKTWRHQQQTMQNVSQDISIMDKCYLSKWNAGNLKKNFHTHKTSNKEEKSSV
jgi:hypothetical protein